MAITIQKTIQCVGVYQDVSKAYGLLDNTDFNLGLKKNRDMTWDPVFRRLRCNGHVINLSAQSFLFPKLADGDKDKSDDYTTDASILRDINGKLPPREFNQREVAEWRKRGPLGKIHNTSVYIAGSNQRIERFKQLSKGLMLLRDNDTRWNSWFKMLTRAFEVRDAVDTFNMLERSQLEDDQLTEEEWEDLEKLMEFLEAYSHAAMSTQGHFATVDKVLPTMEFLLGVLERGKNMYAEDMRFMGPCTKAGWEKLDKWYRRTDDSIAYCAAVVLCPNRKWKFFEKVEWQPAWIRKAKRNVKDLWEQEYKPRTSPESDQTPEPLSTSTSTTKRPNLFAVWEQETLDTPALEDEYEQYLRSPLIALTRDAAKKFDPRAWWLEATQQQAYPNLSKMALDLLSIPAMSAEVERLFSSCKITITDRRNRIGIKSVEAIECLKSWMRSQNISFVDSDIEIVFETGLNEGTGKRKADEMSEDDVDSTSFKEL